jgi:hypothetical protein
MKPLKILESSTSTMCEQDQDEQQHPFFVDDKEDVRRMDREEDCPTWDDISDSTNDMHKGTNPFLLPMNYVPNPCANFSLGTRRGKKRQMESFYYCRDTIEDWQAFLV